MGKAKRKVKPRIVEYLKKNISVNQIFSVSKIKIALKTNHESVLSALNELVDNGVLTRVQAHTKKKFTTFYCLIIDLNKEKFK